jgi:hypothetical protein
MEKYCRNAYFALLRLTSLSGFLLRLLRENQYLLREKLQIVNCISKF